MKRLKPVDVVVAGAGWTGLAMAKELVTRTKLSVLVLERGPARKVSDYATTMDELDYAIRLRMMQNISEETITHRHSIRQRAVPIRQYGSFLPGTGVGGSGEHWSGMCFRYPPDVFSLATALRERHGWASLPPDLAVQDWPVTYGELEPYYWRAERMIGVSGKAGNLRGERIAGGNVFEGPREFEYPTPPVKSSYLSTMFKEATHKLGYHPYPLPAATLSEAYTNSDGIARPGCVYCGYCDRFGCMIGAKAQPSTTLLQVIAHRSNFILRSGCWVRRIVHKGGKAQGVRFTDSNGEEYFQPANIVVLASWTLNNVRLLYLSRIGLPYDPEAGTGTLGRNLTHHVQGATSVFFDRPLNGFMGSGALGTVISDFEGFNGLKENEGILRGGILLSATAGNRPIQTFGNTPSGAVKTDWGSDWKKASLAWWDKVGGISYASEHLSYRHNYMDLDPAYTDKFGDPLLRFTLDWTDHEQRQRAFAIHISHRIARALNAKAFATTPVGRKYDAAFYQSSHVQGGAIMGPNPSQSVVNTFLQHWDMPNLWVVGASAFPQNGAGNPTMTALALTYRAADALIDRYLKAAGPLA
jgi:gluconate 2-dehydrogenase alpha chain